MEINYVCPNCSSSLKFDSQRQYLVCDNCKEQFYLKKSIDNDNTLFSYTCNFCNTKIISKKSLSNCIYCNNHELIKENFNESFNNFCLPFTKTKEDAILKYKEYKKNNLLLPQKFKVDKIKKNIVGLYIPVCLTDVFSEGSIKADCEKITNFKSGNYKYTKTDIYSSMRSGSMRFSNIPICLSNNFNQELFRTIEPFDFKKIKEFDISELDNYYLDKCLLDEEQIEKKSLNKSKELTIDILKQDITGFNDVKVDSNNIKLSNIENSIVYIPVWFIRIKQKEKNYHFLMNGYTGRSSCSLPIDKNKIFIFGFIIFFIIFNILFLIYYIMVML